MIYLISFKQNWKSNVVTNEFKMWARKKIPNVVFASRKEIVDTNDFRSLF